MTYVEFYDKNAIENICACLAMPPKQMVLVGNNKEELEHAAANYKKVFDGRNIHIQYICKPLESWKKDDVVKLIQEIVDEYEDCVFGLTGGDEIVLFALGIVCGANPKKNIQVHRFNIQNNSIHDCDMDGKVIEHEAPRLTVEENIQIYGGELMETDVYGPKTYRWKMDGNFEGDIETMWKICKEHPDSWNSQINVFGVLAEAGSVHADKIQVEISKEAARAACEEAKVKYKMGTIVKRKLEQAKLITVTETEDSITLKFKDAQVKRCLIQAGQALEMKTYLLAKQVKNSKKKPVYTDVMNGVEIDWDGTWDKENLSEDELKNVTNEIDVFLMHNMIPVFVSCKNGQVKMDELYKLNTVASRFGGKYAKKALVARDLDLGRYQEAFINRAEEMNIKLIINDDVRDDAKFKQQMKLLWQS